MSTTVPLGTSRAAVLRALASSASSLGAHRTSRSAYSRLAGLRIGSEVGVARGRGSDLWEQQGLVAMAMPFEDASAAMGSCARCAARSPAVVATGNAGTCANGEENCHDARTVSLSPACLFVYVADFVSY